MASKLALAFASVALTLLLLEGAGRWFESLNAVPAESPELLREPAIREEAELRVHLYGGSTVWGLPSREVGFVAQLRDLLERSLPHRRVTVVNYGVQAGTSTRVVERIAETLSPRPSAIVVMTGHNEFLWRIIDTQVRVVDEIREGLDRLALGRVLRDLLRPALERDRPEFRFPEKLAIWAPESPEFRARVELYRRNLATVVALAHEQNVPLLLATVGANWRDWPPVHRFVRAGEAGRVYEQETANVRRLIAEGETAEAGRLLEAMSQAYPDDAMVAYLRGQRLLELGEVAAARVFLQQARVLDPVPYRVLVGFNEWLRELGSEPGVTLVDVERALERESADDLSGDELFVDNCHPTPRGAQIMAGSVARGLESAGVVEPGRINPDAWDLAAFVASTSFADRQLEYRLWNARYAMKAPFLNFEAARRNLEAAVALDHGQWQAWVLLGTTMVLLGDEADGRRALARAAKLAPEPIDPKRARERFPYLGTALERLGMDPQRLFGQQRDSTAGVVGLEAAVSAP